ncbi:cell adhesion molecule Dscam2-like isoform X2 [Oscarella lobularis]|uniref:cell adhesion molecule Dscam2-like isoform X2 n=1 Tax=Oscarella lobularis TaxID=121494 RepID=UPI00331341F9
MPRSTLGILNITSLRRFDAGLYRCRYEELFSLPAQINVHYIPFLVRANFSGDDVMDFGSSFTLLCIAEGNPIPTVLFYRTTRTLPYVTEILHGGNVHYTDGVTATSKTKETILTIHNTSTSDSGEYFCRASNPHGHVNSSLFHVFIQGPPSSIDPADIVVVRKTNSSIAINWTEPYDGGRAILEYTVSYKEEGSVDDYQVADTVNGSEFATTISDLMELTVYSILVVAENDKGQARGTEPAKVRTEAGVPPSPRDFRAAVWNSTSAFVEWKPAPSQKNKIISYYRVYYVDVRKRPSPLLYAIVGRDKTSDVISGLRSFIKYALHVRAVNEWEDGTQLLAPPTNTMSITTLEDAPCEPQNVTGETIVSSTSTLRVVWKQPIHPNGLIRKYTIYYRKKIPESSQKLNVTVNGDRTAVIIGNLTLYTTYVIQIQAHTIEPGPLSQPVEGVTGQGPPSAPRQLTVLNNGRRSVSLQWTDPAIPRGVVIQYTIFYRGRKWYSGHGRKRESFSVRSSRVVKSPPLTTYTVDDLTPNTLWTFYVAASSEGGIGDASKPVSERTLEAEPSPVVAAPPDPCTFTETTATLPLVAPSEGNGRTGRIDLLVAAVESNSSSDAVDFTTFAPASNVSAAAVNVSALNASQIYVAATFESRDTLPAEFILGRGETVNGYTNAPLRPGTTYRYGLRVYSATNDSLFTTSNPQTLTTLKDIETDGEPMREREREYCFVCSHVECIGCPRCLYTIVSAASCAGGALLGMISIAVLLCCVKRARAVRGYYK